MSEPRISRGMRTDNGEWVYGYAVKGNYGDNKAFIIDYDTPWHSVCREVIPETVGQEIGIVDKNREKLFHGDIVEYKEEYGQIEYHDSEAMYVVSFDSWFTDFDHICGIDVEVVGSVYKNPELIGGK